MTDRNQNASGTGARRVRRAAKVVRGECFDCRDPSVPNRRRCTKHLTAAKVREEMRMARAEGILTAEIKRGPSERKAGAS